MFSTAKGPHSFVALHKVKAIDKSFQERTMLAG